MDMVGEPWPVGGAPPHLNASLAARHAGQMGISPNSLPREFADLWRSPRPEQGSKLRVHGHRKEAHKHEAVLRTTSLLVH